jgi:Putative phage holin Dp-1
MGVEMILNRRIYNFLNFVAQIFLPALGSLYFIQSQVFHFPHIGEIVGTIMIIDFFFGIVLWLCTKTYDGQIVVYENPEEQKKTYSLELNTDPEELENKKEVRFKVTPIESL